MGRRTMGIFVAALLTGACGAERDGQSVATQQEALTAQDVAEAPAASEAVPGGGAIKVALPQIAYTYQHSFRLPADAIASTQDRHIALCDRLGPNRCRVLDMQRSVAEDAAATGSLKMVVAAPIARDFGRALATAAAKAGGTQEDSSIQGEDLSKQIVDTEARLRAKQALADRLMTLLRTRNGPVADLVAAERSVAEVQAEIDAARSWLAEARGRVAMSTVQLNYASAGTTAGALAPVRDALRELSGFFGESLAALIRFVAVALPWAVVLAIGVAIWRRLRRRRLARAQRNPAESGTG